jgi:hypothetical protein
VPTPVAKTRHLLLRPGGPVALAARPWNRTVRRALATRWPLALLLPLLTLSLLSVSPFARSSQAQESAEKPASEKPASEKPASEKPASEKPASEKPASEKPASEKPASEKPASEKPASEKPRIEFPESRGLRATLPDVFYLRDGNGRFVPVPDFSYEDFKRLYDLEKRFAPTVTAPKYVVQHLSLTGTVDPQRAQLRCDLRLVLKSEQWVRVPLQLQGAALVAQPRYDGGDSFFVEREREGEGLVAWIRDRSDQPRTLSLDLVVPVRALSDSYRLQFQSPTATTSDLKLLFPGPDVVAEISEPATLLGLKPLADQRTELQAAGLADEIVINWRGSARTPANSAATLEASSQVTVRVEGPQRVTSEARIKVRGYGAPLEAFRVRLPPGLEWFPLNEPGYRVIPISGVENTAIAPSGKIVEVIPDAKNAYQLEVRLRAVLPPPATAVEETFETAGFEVLGAVRQFGQIECYVEGDWSVDWQAGRFVLPLDLPDAARSPRNSARFEFYRQPCSLRVRVQPRQTRVGVEPLYVVSLGPQQTQLQAILKYRVRGPVATRLQIDLAGWQVQRVEPSEFIREEALAREKNSPLVIPLAVDGVNGLRDFEIRVTAIRSTPFSSPDNNSLELALPIAEGTLLSTARLIVLPDPSLIVTPRTSDMPGLLAQPLPTDWERRPSEPYSAALCYEWRGEVTQPRFQAMVERRQRNLSVGLRSRIEWDERRALVEQLMNYEIDYAAARQLPIAIARELLQPGKLRIEWAREGLEAVPLRVSLPQPDADAPATVVAHVDLPREQLGPMTLRVRYEWQLDEATALKLPTEGAVANEETTWRIPLVGPAADPNTQITRHDLSLTSTSTAQLDVTDRAWTKTVAATALTDQRELAFSTNVAVDGVTLRSTTAQTEPPSDTQIRKAWLQTWQDRWVRQDRVAWRLTTGQSQIDIRVPRETQMTDVLVALNGLRIAPQSLAEGLLRVDLGERDERREWLLELSYRLENSASAIQRATMEFPQIVGAAPAVRQYWQLVLPSDRFLIWAPQRWTPDSQRLSIWPALWSSVWSGADAADDAIRRSRQASLERWVDVQPQAALPEEANEYLFSSFGSLAPVELLIIPRSLLVLGASGFTLLIGWFLWFIPGSRHPAVLGLLAVALAGLFAWLPTLALLLLQASALGLGLILVARLLRALAARPWSQGWQRSWNRGRPPLPVARPLPPDARRPDGSDRGGSSRSLSQTPLATGLLVISLWASAADAGPPADPSPQSPAATPPERSETPRFRRVLVREELLPEVARGHLPVKREEFQRLLDAYRTEPGATTAPRFSQIDWWARWERTQFVDGRVRLRVENKEAAAGWVSLEPCRWPLRDLQWTPALEAQRAATTPLAVNPVVGVPADPTERAAGILVLGAGELRGRWSWRGRDMGADLWQFECGLLSCPRQRIWLDLPAELLVEADDSFAEALVEPVETLPEEMVSAALQGWELPPLTTPTWRRWLIQPLGDRLRLQVTAARARETRVNTTHWREELTYDVTAQGLELQANLRLDVLGEPLRKLQMELPVTLKIGALRLGDQPLVWRDQWNPATATRILEASLPELTGLDQLIQLTALAPLPDTTTFELPTPRLRGLFWQEGKVTVNVYQPLEAASLLVRGNREVRVSNVAAPIPATVFQVQLPSADAQLQLLANSPATQWTTALGTSHRIEETNWEARAVVEATVRAGRATQWQARIPRDWIVDRVELEPDLLSDDFEVTPTADPQWQQLRVRFEQPLTAGRALRVEIHANRPRPAPGTRLTRSQFQLVDLLGGEQPQAEVRAVMSAQLDAASRVVWRRDRELTWLTPDKLTPEEQRILEPHEGATLWRDDQAARDLEMEFTPVLPIYEARIEVRGRVSAAGIWEGSRLRVEPVQGEVTRLLVVFSQRRLTPPVWSIDDQENMPLTIRKLNDNELQAIASAAGEGWEILLRTPRAEPFELRCERLTNWEEPRGTSGAPPAVNLSLVSLPEADEQAGIVRLERRDVEFLVIAPELTTLPLNATENDSPWTPTAAYRYEPTNIRELSLQLTSAEMAMASAWAWSSHLATQFARTGEAWYEATYWIENRGTSQVQVEFPEGSSGWQILVNDLLASQGSNSSHEERKQDVSLNPGERFTKLQLKYRLQDDPWRFWSRCQPRLPALSIPVRGGSWRCWLPSGFVPTHSPRNPLVSTPTQAWQRLFQLVYPVEDGPLAWAGSPLSQLNDWSDEWLGHGGNSTAASEQQAITLLLILGRIIAEAQADGEAKSGTALPRDTTSRSERPRSFNQNSVVTWQQIWREFEQAIAELRPAASLLLDSDQLAAQGILPSALLEGPLPIPPRAAPFTDPSVDEFEKSKRERLRFAWEVDRYLARQGVMLLGRPQTILVTTQAVHQPPAQSNSRWRAIDLGATAAEHHASTELGQWLSLPGPAELPWTAHSAEPPLPEVAGPEWNWDWPTATTTAVPVIDGSMIAVASWAALLVTASLLVMLAGRWPSILASAPALAAAITWYLPAPLVSLGSGLFLGSLLAIIWYWTRRSHQPLRPTTEAAPPNTTTKPTATTRWLATTTCLILLVGLLLWIKSATPRVWGQEPPRANSGREPVTAANAPAAQSSPASPAAPASNPSADDLEGIPNRAAETAQSEIYRVLYPLGEDGQLSGDYVHVPRDFYDRLRIQSVAPRAAVPSTIWRAAEYELEFRETADANRWQVPALRLRWEIATTVENQWLTLPLTRESVSLLSQAWRHNDQPVELFTEVTSSGWRVELTRPGTYQVEFVVRPLLQRRRNRVILELPIPPLASAVAVVRGPALPELAQELTFPSAQGSITLAEGGQDLRVELGASSALIVEWNRGALETDLRVEQLSWWQLRPGAVTLETRLTFRAQQPLPRTMKLSVDRRLRLLPTEDGQPAVRWMAGAPSPAGGGSAPNSAPNSATNPAANSGTNTANGNVNGGSEATGEVAAEAAGEALLEWDWDDEVTDTASITLSFLWTNAAGVGHWQLPRLEPLEARVERHWLAVSTGADLQAQLIGLPAEAAVEPREFLEAWPGKVTPPQFAWQVATVPSESAAAWYLATLPRETRVTGEEQLAITVSAQRTHWQLRSLVTLPASTLQLLRWRIPAQSTIEQVRVSGVEEVEVAHWLTSGDVLYVRLSQPVTAACEFLIAGSIATQLATPARLAEPQSLEMGDHEVGVRMFCDGTVRVEFLEPPPTVQEPDEAAGPASSDRWLARWQQRRGGSEPPSSVVYSVLETQFQATGRQITLMQVDETGSRTLVMGKVDVLRDPIDLLRWEVPRDWSVPPPARPLGSWSLRPSSAADRQILELRLPQPRSGTISFAFQSPNLPPGEQRQGIPLVRLLDMENAEQYLSLPTSTAAGQMTWDTSGMEAINMSDRPTWLTSEWLTDEELSRWFNQLENPLPLSDLATRTTYRLIGQRWRAQLRTIEPVAREPRVLLAEHELEVDGEGRYWGLGVLDVDAGEHAQTELVLPVEARLVHADIDGSSVGLERQTAERWTIHWGVSAGPRRVRLLFQGQLPTARSAGTEPPHAQLPSLPVERTYWTLRVAAGAGWELSDQRASPLDGVDFARERLSARTEVLQGAADSLLRQAPRDQDTRLIPWSRQWYTARAALDQATQQQTARAVSTGSVERQPQDDGLAKTAARSVPAAWQRLWSWLARSSTVAVPVRPPNIDDARQLAVLNQRQLDIAGQFHLPEAWEMGRQQASQCRDWDQLWQMTPERLPSGMNFDLRLPVAATELHGREELSSVVLRSRWTPAAGKTVDFGQLLARWTPFALVALAGLLVQLWTARGGLSETLARTPQWFLAVLGIGWWLWLPAPAAGLVLAALASLDALRSPWRSFRR